MGFNGNEIPRSVHEVDSTIAPRDIANDDWDDDSVASGAGGDGVSARRAKNSLKRIEGMEQDKRGKVIRTCGVAVFQYKTIMANMKKHKAAKHGINVVWFSCDQDNCHFKANRAGNLKRHNNIFTTLTCDGTTAIHATTKPSPLARSNYTNDIFTTSMSFGTSAIHATSKPSEQATSKFIKNESTKPKNVFYNKLILLYYCNNQSQPHNKQQQPAQPSKYSPPN